MPFHLLYQMNNVESYFSVNKIFGSND